MATGANIQPGRGIATTGLAPQISFDDGSAQVWDEAARAANKLGRTENAIYKRIAERRGAEQGAAVAAGEQDAPRRGPLEALLSGGEVYAAREAAYSRAYIAGVSNDFDGQEAEVRLRNAGNPEGYEREMQAVRSGFIQGADPQYAVDVEEYANRRTQAGLASVSEQAARVQIEEANTTLVERLGRLEGRALAMIDDGQDRTIEFEIIRDEYEQILAQRVANPLIPYSQEQMDADLREFGIKGQARAAARYVREVLETDGAVAALDEVERLRADPTIDPLARATIVETAREAANAGIQDMQRRVNLVQQAENERTAEINRLIDEDVADIQLGGEGVGLTAEQVRAAGGRDAEVRWLRRRADAYEFQNLVGQLPLDDPEAAARQIAQASEDRAGNFDTGFGLISDDTDLGTLRAAIIQVESNGRNGLVSADPDGAGGGGGGAFGIMQVLPATAETVARSLGIRFDADNPADRERLRTDAAFNQQIGEAYLRQLLDRYNGDAFLATTAYHAGEGNVDGWLRSVGDPRSGQISREAWLSGIEARGNPLSAEYPRKVLRAMRAGRQAATWDQYSDRRAAARQDPGSFVQNDFAVRAAREAWQENPNSVSATEDYIRANIAAQERMGIREGDRATLPGQSLAVYAGDLERYARAGDTDGFNAYAERIVRNHGRFGERVLQDALEMRGDTRWAAIVSARATARQTRGQRPPPGEQQAVASAARAETINRVASGTQRNVSAMSDEELRAIAGL